MLTRNYLFVCGCPRSGTTALMRLLNAHSGIVLGVERYKKYAKKENLKYLTKDVFESEYFFDIKPQQTNLNSSHKAWEREWKKLYQDMEPKFNQSTLLVGDKYPHYFLFYKEINKKFDHPKWIFMIRDVYQVALSYNARASNSKDKWSKERNYTAAVFDWNDSIRRTWDFLELGAKNIFLCEYSKIFSYDVKYLEAMLDFLEVGSDRRIEDFYGKMTKDWKTRLSKRKTLESEQEEYVRRNSDWATYDTLMQKYGLLEVASE